MVISLRHQLTHKTYTMIENQIRQILREEIQLALGSLELKLQGQESNSRWLTTKQTAKYLGISIASVYNWVDSGKLERYYLQNIPRYDKYEIDEILKNSSI